MDLRDDEELRPSEAFGWTDVEAWATAGLIDPNAPARIRAFVGASQVEPATASPSVVALPASTDSPAAVATARRLWFTTIASYLGGFMVLLAFTIFVGIQWAAIGDGGRLFLSTVSLAVVMGIGLALRSSGFDTAGGLLATAAAAILPLVIYSFEKATGIWPDGRDPGPYDSFYREVLPAWVGMEVVSIATTIVLLRWLRFPLLTLLVAFWSWYLSMDLARWVAGSDDRSWTSGGEQWVSLGSTSSATSRC